MQQKFDVNKALPACGLVLNKAEASVHDLSQHTFYHFTDIDFREIGSNSRKTSVVRAQDPFESKGGTKNSALFAAAPLLGLAQSRGSDRSQRGGFFKRMFSGSSPEPEPDKSKDKTEPDNKKEGGFKELVKSLWKIWEKPTQLFPSPWNNVIKWGVPFVAATCAAIWFQTVVQVGILTAELFGGLLKPIAVTGALLTAIPTADKIFKGIEKLCHIDSISGWKRQAIIKPIQAALFAGATVWTLSVGLTPITYALWSATAVASGCLLNKIIKNAKPAIWGSVAAAIALPWAHALTQRTFDVTVLGAGPDPEVGAWNVKTDLSKVDHWKSVAFFGKQSPPSGKSGMIFLNRDVPLYIPSHRAGNEFNGDFVNLVGKRVEVTTIGAWLKPISSKLQPTIVKFRVIDSEAKN
jgi:hypothetical protein